mmetsp:Transcript_96057/g.200673  ORF Transcript_96057/g.200673 Transcript_96057/m.200673 type:complete len:295 (-) Transcript_96057:56-940(-)
MHPHLIQDLRLLWRVLCRAPGNINAAPPAKEDQLLKEVFLSVSETASDVLRKLCQEEAALKAGATLSAKDSAPQVEVFMSPVAEPLETLGVRAAHQTAPGTVLAFYPGRIFYGDEKNLPLSNMLFSNEYEGVSMDGAGWYPKHLQNEVSIREQLPKTVLWHGNRLAVGNLCNHPPKGTFPNVVPMAFRWPSWQELGQETPAHWARLIPHVAVRGGQIVHTASGPKHTEPGKEKEFFPPWPFLGMALVAIRPIAMKEELFWNYRLHPRADEVVGKYPPWYTPVDDLALEQVVAAR